MTTEELKERIRRFGIRILKMSDHLPKSYSALVISKQITRSASSAGANYRAACRKNKSIFEIKKQINNSFYLRLHKIFDLRMNFWIYDF
jgi:four helix bundle protein